MEDQLRIHTYRALEQLGVEVDDVVFEYPADTAHGDFSTNVAMRYAKQLGKNPRELAEAIVEKLGDIEGVEKIAIAGPGFINFYLTREFFVGSVQEVLDQDANWGKNNALDCQKIMVEYTQPNPFKPFHIGHLMSNAIGESISRIIAHSGADVVRANYQGDVGLHIGKALWGLKDLGGDPSNLEDIGNAYVHGNTKYEGGGPEKDEIIAVNKAVYAMDSSIEEAYKTGREVTLRHFEDLYDILGTKFDYYFFESACVEPGKQMVTRGQEIGIFEDSEGAVVFHGENHDAKLHTRVFLTKEGLPTYEAKELGLAELKKQSVAFDQSITTTAVEQAGYFDVVYKALELLDESLVGKLRHVSHGMMQLTSGKMSSRKGDVITGESLINDMVVMAQEKVADRDLPEDMKEQITKDVAVAAIKYSILRQSAGKNIVFDPEQSLSFEGDSGPYLQYAHTRALSVLEKAEHENVSIGCDTPTGDVSSFEKILHRFPSVVNRSREEFEPHHITTYLTQLASEFSSWYASEKILDGSPESAYKLALTKAFQITMRNGLHLLGIRTPERM